MRGYWNVFEDNDGWVDRCIERIESAASRIINLIRSLIRWFR